MLHLAHDSTLVAGRLSAPQRLVHISHARQDEAWVRGVVIPALGLADGQYWTRAEDHPGAPRIQELERAVQSCRYTLLIASNAARVDEWTTFAGILAQHLGLEEGKPRLLILTKDFEPGSGRARSLLPLRHRCLVLLDCSDAKQSAASLEMLAARLALIAVEAPPAECPYPGLRMFGAGASDSCFNRTDLFFGRDEEGRQVIDRLRRCRKALLVGPSGCGKSSLVRARVLPALADGPERMVITIVRPGQRPDQALHAALDSFDPSLGLAIGTWPGVAGEAAALALWPGVQERAARLIYIDQLEEVFLDDSAVGNQERASFFAALSTLCKFPGVAVLLSMRADFYGDLMRSSVWNDYKDHRIELTPLRGPALRQAIIRPAAAVGVYIEVDLVERLVREAELDRAAEALPLLQVALEQLWEQREWRYLSLASYERIADHDRRGLDVVLGRHADSVIDSLGAPMQALARRVLTDLVHLGDGRPDTRRRRSTAELCRVGDRREMMAQLLHHLLDKRLIAVGANDPTARQAMKSPPLEGALAPPARYIDLAHDTLITGWPALAGWIDERRDKLRTQRRLEARVSGGGLLAASELPEFTRWIAWTATPAGQELGASEALRMLVRRSVAARTRRLAGLIAIIITLTLAAGVTYRERQLAADNARLADARADEAARANTTAQEQSQIATSKAQQAKAAQDARTKAEAKADEKDLEAAQATSQAKQKAMLAKHASVKAQEASDREKETARREKIQRDQNEQHQQAERERQAKRKEMSTQIIMTLPDE